MTSRERLLATLTCQPVDGVPMNTYELAGRNSRDWYNNQPSNQSLMNYLCGHTDCITNWNPRPATDRYTCEERFLCSDSCKSIRTTCRNKRRWRRPIRSGFATR